MKNGIAGAGFSLGDLAAPTSYTQPLNVRDFSAEVLCKFLRQMMEIRAVERKLAREREQGVIGGPVHLGVGQEAAATGVSHALNTRDSIFGAHRSHSHLLAMGSDIRRLFAEILGRDTGLSKGMGGSMHLWDGERGFKGSVPIVSGTVPLAVGAAMAARLRNDNSVAVAYFGDGACEEGVVHESLNLASIQKDPVLFVVENNFFASHMHITERQPFNSTSRFAVANDIRHAVVDGNDVVAVAEAAESLVQAARRGEGPGFLELITYRWFGHVDWREDIDVGVSRSREEVDQWRLKDPIKRLEAALVQHGIIETSWIADKTSQIDQMIEECWEVALRDPFPSEDALLERVYSRC